MGFCTARLPEQLWLCHSGYAFGYLFPQEMPHHLETLYFSCYKIKLIEMNIFCQLPYVLERLQLQNGVRRQTSQKAHINWLQRVPQPLGCEYHRHVSQRRHRNGCAKAIA